MPSPVFTSQRSATTRALFQAYVDRADAIQLLCWPYEVPSLLDTSNPLASCVGAEGAQSLASRTVFVEAGTIAVVGVDGEFHTHPRFYHHGEWSEGYLCRIRTSSGELLYTDQLELMSAIAGTWDPKAFRHTFSPRVDFGHPTVAPLASFLDEVRFMAPEVGDLGWRRVRPFFGTDGWTTQQGALLHCHSSHEAFLSYWHHGVWQATADPAQTSGAVNADGIPHTDNTTAEMRGMKADIELMEGQLENREHQIRELNSSVDGRRRQLAERDIRILQLEAQVRELEEQPDQYVDASISKLRRRVVDLERDLATAIDRRGSPAPKQDASLIGETVRLRSTNDKLSAEIRHLRHRLTASQAKQADARDAAGSSSNSGCLLCLAAGVVTIAGMLFAVFA